MPKRIMIQCASEVNKDAVTRETVDGVEHIIVSSFTLPDNVVMNGGLYPADEIAASFHTLERTLAPVEHPVDSKGNFLSATDPIALHGFHAGAFNMNVTRKNGRVHVEKHIDVQEAMKTERGKRLLDRVTEIETNEKPRPISTSTGIFLEVEDLAEPKTNATGAEYSWIARNMVFDHDAILLDSVAAATPSEGVGMAVNAAGDKVKVHRVILDPTEARQERPFAPADHRTNQEGDGQKDSFAQVQEQLQQAIQGVVTADWIFLVDVFDDIAIFETPQGFFQVPWMRTDDGVELSGIPIRVVKEVTFTPKINSNGGNEKMKELMINALKEAGIETEGLDDDKLFAKYNELMATNEAAAVEKAVGEATAGGDDEGGSDDPVVNAVTAAMKPLTEKVDGIIASMNAEGDAELTKLAEIVGNSDKQPGIDVEEAKALPLGTLRKMAANCAEAHGLDLNVNLDGEDKAFAAPAEMPK